jgi:iron-sulfur cluster repair protein YtfE (RIC family)
MIAKGHAPDRTVSRHLVADHARLDALFDDACDRVGGGDFVGASGVFHAFAHGLQHHIDIEERFLFPVFDARVPLRGPTTVMRHEHRAIEQLLATAGASLKARDAGQFATDAAELAALVKAHNLKEERVVYPQTDAALDDAERAELVTALELY